MWRRIMTERTLVGLIALFAVALRAAWQIRTGFYEGPLAFEEDQIARNILAGQGYYYHFHELGVDFASFGLTGLPLLLVLLHFFDPGYTLIGIVQASLSAIVVVASYMLGSRLSSPRAGLIAALAVAVHPGLIIMSARAVISPVYDHAVAAMAYVTAIGLLGRRDAAHGIRFGLSAALSAFMRPTVAVAQAAVLAVLALRPPRTALAIAAAIALLVPVGMAARNALTLGPPGSTAMFCVQLWVGNNPYGSGGAFTSDGRAGVFDVLPPEILAVVGRSEAEIGRVFCDATAAYLLADVPAAIGWQLTKLYYFWWFSPLAGILYPPGWIDAYRALYTVELAFATIGSVVIWRSRARGALLVLVLMMMVIAASQVLFYIEGRHRLIVEAPLAAIASCGVVRAGAWLRALLSRSRSPTILRIARGFEN